MSVQSVLVSQMSERKLVIFKALFTDKAFAGSLQNLREFDALALQDFTIP